MNTPTKKPIPHVLFACTHNAGRSQMARAFLRYYGGDNVIVESGGSEPADAPHDEVVKLLSSLSLEQYLDSPKLLTGALVSQSDFVITMGCGESCPIFPGRTYRDWAISDPKGVDADTLRGIAQDINVLVWDLLEELEIDPAHPRLNLLL